MKRTTIAAVWIAGATVPALLATLFIFGCCVLPFHGVIHKILPICSIAAKIMSGHQSDQAGAQQPAKTAEKESLKRLATEVPNQFRLVIAGNSTAAASPSAMTDYRSFISLGASRCDQDVGVYLLVETFLI